MTVADIRFDWNPSMDAVPESLRGVPGGNGGERRERLHAIGHVGLCARDGEAARESAGHPPARLCDDAPQGAGVGCRPRLLL